MTQPQVNHIGHLKFTPDSDSILVENDGQYVLACASLTKFLRYETRSIPIIWVRSKNHFQWLKSFAEQTNCPTQFINKTPRTVLADKWHVKLPDWLKDEMVFENGLLNLNIVKGSAADFETCMLVHFFGDRFKPERLGISEVSPVVQALVDPETEKTLNENPILKKCLESKCLSWAENSQEEWVSKICRALHHKPKQVWKWLTLWAGLHAYPRKLLEYVLTPEQIMLVTEVPPETVFNLSLEPTARDQLITQIEFFFNEMTGQVRTSEDFQKILGMVSGRLINEFNHISFILKNNKIEPTRDIILEAKKKFESCPGVSKHQLRLLDFFVKPDRPKIPSFQLVRGWSAYDWINWTVNEYTPYRTWQEHQGYYDEDLEQMTADFTRWYIHEYASIHQDQALSLVHCLSSLANRQNSNCLDVVLLVDCLPLAYMKVFEEKFFEKGFHRSEIHYRFAALPTDTTHNKPALLSGQWLEKYPSYEAIINQRALYDWHGSPSFYVHTLKGLQDIDPPEQGGVVVLNMLEADEILHEDMEAKATTYEEELERLFTRLADSVNSMVQKWTGDQGKIEISVVTDHGACRILEEETSTFDSRIVNRFFSNERYRFSAVDQDKSKDIPENIWQLGHKFKNPFVSELTTYFLPSGHNTVRGAGKIKGYMHGGVTPEEVIVPVARYRLFDPGWKEPLVRFLDLDVDKATGRAKFNIQRLTQLKLEIQNPNPMGVEVVRAEIVTPETDIRSFDRVVVQGGESSTFSIGCYFYKQALGHKPLEIELTYELSGAQQTLSLNLECDFRSAMKTGFSLKDL